MNRPEASRAVRGGVFAVFAVLLAAMAHAAAGSDLPDPAIMALGGGLLGFAAAGLARKVRRFPEVTGALLGAQVLLHVLFALGGHHGDVVLPSGLMLAAHVVAALLTAAVMAAAEAATARMRHGRARVLGLLTPMMPAVERPWSVLAEPGLLLPCRASEVVSSRPRRGPPVNG